MVLCLSSVIGLACLIGGCALEEEQMKLRGEFDANVGLFGEASKAFVNTADQLSTQKHGLQKQLIQKDSQTWIARNTGPDGKLTVTAAEMSAFLEKRDAAVALAVSSQQTWERVSRDYKDAIDDFVKLAHNIYGTEVDAAEAKKKLAEVGRGAINLLVGSGTAAAIAVPLGF